MMEGGDATELAMAVGPLGTFYKVLVAQKT